MRSRIEHRLSLLLVAATACSGQKIAAPRIWNDQALADWAAPVAGINVRPGLISEKEYYATPPGEWLRTYPVYFPGREPAGYWEMLRNRKPEPLIAPGPRSEAEWIAAGRIVFDELDNVEDRSYDPRYLAILRSAEEFAKMNGHPQPDGTVQGLRLVPTGKGLAISTRQCAGCHVRTMPDGALLPGAPDHDSGDRVAAELFAAGERVLLGPSHARALWRSFAVPWVRNDIHRGIHFMSPQDLRDLLGSNVAGTFPRFNGSPWFTAKMPDLIGIGERRFIDATATHRLRSPEDIARYAALVTCCDAGVFGPYHMLTPRQAAVKNPFSDDLLYALARYLVSLQPPRNPNTGDARATAGKGIFEREGCAGCHPPPLYTSNKLTLAKGYQAPGNHPFATDIMPVSVGTDPNLALRTRKGTGLYKIPSLKGVWYRGLYGHDGSVASLEEWLSPARLRDDYVPGGFKGYRVEHRAVPGHEFGVRLNEEDKAALIAFLRTL